MTGTKCRGHGTRTHDIALGCRFLGADACVSFVLRTCSIWPIFGLSHRHGSFRACELLFPSQPVPLVDRGFYHRVHASDPWISPWESWVSAISARTAAPLCVFFHSGLCSLLRRLLFAGVFSGHVLLYALTG